MAAYVDCGEFAGGTDPVTVTVGFEPKLVLVWGSLQSGYGGFSADNYFVCGCAKGTPTNEANQFTEGFAASWNGSAFFGPMARRGLRGGEIISDINVGGITGNLASIDQLTSTGFRINFSIGNGSGSRYQWIAIGGDDVDVAIGSLSTPAVTGPQSVTGLGLTPSFYLTIGGSTGQSANGIYYSMGICDGTRQGVSGWHQFGGSIGNAGTPNDVTNYQRTTKVAAVLNDLTGAVLGEAAHVSMDSDGFTINWTTAPAVSETIKYIAVSGLTAHVGALTQPSAAGNQTISGLDVTPSAVLFLSAGMPASTSVQNDLRFTIGVGKPATNLAVFNGDNDGIAAIGNRRNVRYASNTSCLVHAQPTSTTGGSVQAEAAVTDLGETAGAGYFTLTWASADATARQTLYLALGPLASGPVVDDGSEPAYVVTIDGDDINPIKETFRIQETLDAPDTLLCDVDSEGLPYTRFSLGQTVTVTENGVRVFGGYVTGVRERGLCGPNTDDLVVEIQATSYELNAQRRVITTEFSAGSPADSLSDALASLVTDYFGVVGVSLHPSQATGPDLPYLSFQRARGDALIRTIAESLGYLWSIDYQNQLRAWLPGDIAAPDDYDEDVNPELLTGDIEVEKHLQNGYANRVILVGAPIAVPDYVDLFTGDGVTDTFDLTYDVVSTYGYVVNNGIAETLRETSGAFGSADWVVDRVARTITRDAGAPANGKPISITYNGLFVPSATAEDAGEIAALGLYEHLEEVTSVPENLSAQQYADAILAQKIASKDEIVIVKTRRLGFHPGQTMAMTSPTRELTGTYLLTQVDTGAEVDGVRLIRSITATKSQNNLHDWRKVLQQWSQNTSTTSSVVSGGSTTQGQGLGLHAARHQQGGIDPIKLDDLATPDDNTDLNVSTSRHGLTPKISGSDGDVLTKSGAAAVWATASGSGGSGTGNVTDSTVFGSEPAGSPGPDVGDLDLYSNAPLISRYTGSVWVPWGPIFPLTAPVSPDFSWINQGPASIDTTNGGIYLLAPAGAGDNMRIRKKTAPSTPYTITAAFLHMVTAIDAPNIGMVFRQSSDGKLATCGFGGNATDVKTSLGALKFTNPTAFSASYASVAFYPSNVLWLRIADDGANRICSWSADGQHWFVLHTIGRTDFLTADEVGFYANSNNATWPVALTLLSWKET